MRTEQNIRNKKFFKDQETKAAHRLLFFSPKRAIIQIALKFCYRYF